VPRRRERIRVVLDTNVVLGFYLSRSLGSPNSQVIRLWRDHRKLQLIVSEDVVAEYLDVLRRLDVPEERVLRFAERLETRATVTRVNLGRRLTESRDPDDNVVLSTAATGRAGFLVTNDRDLLDIPAEDRRRFRFEIVTPWEFLAAIEERKEEE
jgi:putative PIN family toxin of toxin-antitoxin system